MYTYYLLRRWTAWAVGLLLTAAGCATSGTVRNAAVVPPSGDSMARAWSGPNGSRSRPAAARSNRPAVPGTAPTGARYASTRPATAPAASLQQRVVQFTRQPTELMNPPTPVRQWRFIVLHHSGEQSGGYASIDRFHRGPDRGWDECGYHFVIGNGSESGDGEIEVGSRWLKQKHGAHTHPPGHTEYNEEGLGICLIGDCNESAPTPRQIEACRRLIDYLQARCGVDSSNVITHGDAENANTDCPGRHFPYDRLVPRSRSGFVSR